MKATNYDFRVRGPNWSMSNFEKEKETQEVLTRTKLGVKEQLHGEE